MKISSFLFITIFMCHSLSAQETDFWQVDNLKDWLTADADGANVELKEAVDWGGVIDLMGNGALLLKKVKSESLYTRVSEFHSTGEWTSQWHDFGLQVTMRSLETEIIGYGKKLDTRKGWIKFSGNPVLSGENTLLPLNPENISDQTILLPLPGGVPQDQSIVRGRGQWEGKWILYFNHTPDAWPNDYYWSVAIADSLSPLKDGINPFSIDTTIFPLYGPIDNHAPNDWLEVDGITYAPDENYLGESHMWKSDDMLNWVDMGPITGINGSDPGMVYDGREYFLFNESENVLNYNKLSSDFTNIVEGSTVLDVEDHTGDADLGFFNNQWHMFFDDGPHLHYNIGHASTTPEEFPFGWIKENDIYGPHNPEQGQRWDDDTKEGNDFGTGDADIAIEGNTLYMFTERPVGAAYKELTELYDGTGLNIEALVEVDENGDGIADDSTDWKKIVPGKTVWSWSKELSGQHFRLSFKLNSENSTESPMIQYFKLSSEHSKPVRLNLNTDLPKILNFRDSISTVTCSITDSQDRLSVAADSLVFFSLIGNGNLEGDNPMRAQQGKATITYVPGAAVGRQIIVAESAGLLSDTVTIDVDNRLLVDDFENYESENDLSLVWHGHAGLTADLFLNRLDDGTDLGYAYRVGNGSPPFSGIFHNFDYDLSGISHLGFWLKADSSSREFIIRLEEGGIRDWDYSLPMNDSEFSNFQIDLNNFTANDGAEKIDIQALSKLSFFVLPGDGGFGADTIYIDEISFLSHQVSRLPKKLTVKNPADFKLYKNFPNPFNPATKIRFSLPFSTKIELTIFDVLGRRVKKLLNSDEKAGEHEIEFDGSGLSSGIYIYALRAEAWHDSKKMLLLK